MNERIKELAEQAEKQVRVETKSDLGYMGFEIDEDEFRRVFAELIVQECQTVVEWAINVDSTIDRVPVLIKEHFGVEE
jgi:uncharacterized protein YfbU (UPF0304 family)